MSRRSGLTGSALVRLVTQLTDAQVRDPATDFADRLGHWLGWTDALSLSAALDGDALAASPGQAPSPRERGRARAAGFPEQAECEGLQAALAHAIRMDAQVIDRPRPAPAPGAHPPAAARMLAEADPDHAAQAEGPFGPHRRRYLGRQQSMDMAIGALRGRLRTRLASLSGEHARLAALDVVMEQALGTRERPLLAGLAPVLERHFGKLRQAALDEALAQAPEDTEAAAKAIDAPDAPWQAAFRADLQALLLAELEFRFQPLEGLLEALRPRQTHLTPS